MGCPQLLLWGFELVSGFGLLSGFGLVLRPGIIVRSSFGVLVGLAWCALAIRAAPAKLREVLAVSCSRFARQPS